MRLKENKNETEKCWNEKGETKRIIQIKTGA